MPKGVRIGLIVLAVIIGFLIAVSIIAPRLFKIDSYRGYVVSELDQQTGRKISIGHLGLTIFPAIAIRAERVAVANPPGFTAGNWFSARRIDAHLDFGALLHRQIVIHVLHIDEPNLSLLQNQEGVWNYQLPARGAVAPVSAKSGSDPALFTLREISNVVIKGGVVSATMASPAAGSERIICKGVSANVKNIVLADSNSPPNRAAQAPPAVLPSSSGELEVSSISVGPVTATNFSSPIQTSPAGVALSKLQFDFYSGAGHGTAQMNLSGMAPPQYQTQIQLMNVNVEKLLDAFPAWRGAITGEMDADLALRGAASQSPAPLDGASGHGTITVRKGRLPKIQLNRSLVDLMRVAQIGPSKGDLSNFSSIIATWQLAAGVLSNPSIRILGSGVTVDGAGYAQLAGAGSLHYHGTAEIQAHRNALTSIIADVSGAAFKNGKITLSFVLEGTLKNPLFRLSGPAPAGTPSPVPAAPKPANAIRDLLNLLGSKKSRK